MGTAPDGGRDVNVKLLVVAGVVLAGAVACGPGGSAEPGPSPVVGCTMNYVEFMGADGKVDTEKVFVRNDTGAGGMVRITAVGGSGRTFWKQQHASEGATVELVAPEQLVKVNIKANVAPDSGGLVVCEWE